MSKEPGETSHEQTARDMGHQPLIDLMLQYGVTPQHLVAASTEQLTFKMIARAARGRWCTLNTRQKVLRALRTAAGRSYSLNELFTY